MKHYLRRLLESMDYYDPGCDYDLFIADNVSEDGTVDFLTNEFKKRENFTRLHLSKDNLWDHHVYNSWIPLIWTDNILFLNADVRVTANNWCRDVVSELDDMPKLGLLGIYSAEGEAVTPDEAPEKKEWIRQLYLNRVGKDFDHCGHIQQSMFAASRGLFQEAGTFWLPRILTDRIDNIASEIEFSVRLRKMGYLLQRSQSIKMHFHHFAQRFPMKTYEEILARERKLKLPEMT